MVIIVLYGVPCDLAGSGLLDDLRRRIRCKASGAVLNHSPEDVDIYISTDLAHIDEAQRMFCNIQTDLSLTPEEVGRLVDSVEEVLLYIFPERKIRLKYGSDVSRKVGGKTTGSRLSF